MSCYDKNSVSIRHTSEWVNILFSKSRHLPYLKKILFHYQLPHFSRINEFCESLVRKKKTKFRYFLWRWHILVYFYFLQFSQIFVVLLFYLTSFLHAVVDAAVFMVFSAILPKWLYVTIYKKNPRKHKLQVSTIVFFVVESFKQNLSHVTDEAFFFTPSENMIFVHWEKFQ